MLTLGVAAVAASYVESPGQEWTALLLDRGFEAGPGLAASGPLVFSIGLVASRLLLDPLVDRLTRTVIARIAGIGAGPVFPLLFGAPPPVPLEVKLAAVLDVEGGSSVSATARRHDVSRQSVYRWRRNYHEQGPSGSRH